jgi:hypothetical protein
MRKLYRYEYVKKFGVDFLFFSAPWVKQGNSSFTSKVSLQVLKTSKRNFNNLFFGTQNLYLVNLIGYFFQRYNEDVRRFTYYESKNLYNDLLKALILYCGSYNSTNIDFKTLFKIIHNFNLFIGSSNHYKLSKLFFCFASLYNSNINQMCNYSFFSPEYIGAKNSLLFLSIRTNKVNDINNCATGLGLRSKGVVNVLESTVISSKFLFNKFNEII